MFFWLCFWGAYPSGRGFVGGFTLIFDQRCSGMHHRTPKNSEPKEAQQAAEWTVIVPCLVHRCSVLLQVAPVQRSAHKESYMMASFLWKIQRNWALQMRLFIRKARGGKKLWIRKIASSGFHATATHSVSWRAPAPEPPLTRRSLPGLVKMLRGYAGCWIPLLGFHSRKKPDKESPGNG